MLYTEVEIRFSDVNTESVKLLVMFSCEKMFRSFWPEIIACDIGLGGIEGWVVWGDNRLIKTSSTPFCVVCVFSFVL